jgi:type I restriction enzyme S subunit
MSQVELTTLEKSCEFFNGKAHEKSIDENGKYIVVNSKFISQEGKVVKRTKEQMFPLYKGDIVMVMSDVPNGKALAKCFIIDQDDTYSLNQRICCIRSKEFDTKYLYYQLNRHEHFLAFNNGENQTNLRKDDILDCPLIKPSMDEQRRMVAELDNAYKALESAKLNIEKNINNSREIFDTYLKEIFENPGESVTVEKLVDVCSILTCGVASTPKYVDESLGVPFLSAQNVKNGEIILDKYNYISKEFHEKLTKKNKPTKGDILYSRVGAKYGEAGVVEHEFEFSVYVSVTLIRTIPNKVNNYYLKYYLNSPLIKELAKKSITSSGVPNLNVKDVREFPINYPSLTKQQEIISKIKALEVEYKKLEGIYSKKLENVKEMNDGIINRAFENELIEAE